MKTSLLSHALWALIAVGAFLAGWTANDPAPSALPPAEGTVTTRPESETGGSVTGAGPGEALSEKVALTAEQARVQTFELLSVPDRLERLTRLCEMLRQMTKENWRDISTAFNRQTEFTGRTHSAEWRLMLDRVGEVAGADALEETLADGTNRPRLTAIAEGWAAGDPQAAMQWLEAQSPERQRELAGAFVSGLARTDPATALTYIGTRMPEARDELMPEIVNGLIQQSGFQRAEEILATLRARDDIPSPVLGSYYVSLAQRQIQRARLRGDPQSVLAWADRTTGPGLPGPGALKDLVNFAAETDAPGTFDWVIDRSIQWNPSQIDRVFPVIAAAYQKQAPEKFAVWISANPDHPQRDILAATVAQSIASAGDYDTALQWAQTLAPGDLRTRLEEKIAERREKRAP